MEDHNNSYHHKMTATMKFDDIIAELGEFGPYQKKIYFLVCLAGMPAAFHTMIGVFTLAVPDHRCALPSLPNDTYKSQGEWHDDLVYMSVPWSSDDDAYEECLLYIEGPDSIIYRNETMTCSKWVYKKDPFESTFVTETNLVCDDLRLRTYANMILMGGLLVGSLIMGLLTDLIGRKKVLLVCLAGQFGVALAAAFVSSYTPFIILIFFSTFFGSGYFLSAFVIGMEFVGPSKRKISGIVIEMFWTLGLFIQTGLAYGFRDWSHLQIAGSAPIILLPVIYAFLLPESPRWLINKAKYEDAAKILRRAAKGNDVVLPEKMLKLENLELKGKDEKIWHMFTSAVLIVRCLVILFIWLVASMVYYGLSLNVGGLSGDIYFNFFLSALVELASYAFCLLLLDILGRKPLLCMGMLVGGVACISSTFAVIYGSSDVEWVTVALSLIGKFGASAAFAVVFVYSAELFPTVMRNAGMGLSSFCARIGGILAPYTADIGNRIEGDIADVLPLLIFGSVSIVAGLLALLLPETAHKVLPDTLEDARNFGKLQRFRRSVAVSASLIRLRTSPNKAKSTFPSSNRPRSIFSVSEERRNPQRAKYRKDGDISERASPEIPEALHRHRGDGKKLTKTVKF